MTTPTPDRLTVLLGGREYTGWMTMRISRAIDKLATDFDITVTETWPGQIDPWQIPVFSPVQLKLGADLALTGYVDAAFPSYDGRSHTVRIAGRSKTGDLIDCMSELGPEFRGTTLPALARAICAPFGIEVVDQSGIGAAFLTASFDAVTDTAFAFLEKQSRLRAVLLTDDEQGRIVLTRAGESRAAGRIEEGVNIQSAKVEFNVSRRFSKYLVKAQRAHGGAASWAGAGTEGAAPAGGGVDVAVVGSALDATVPRYRAHVTTAETALTAAEARDRAVWQAAYAGGRATKLHVVLRGWRQQDGKLWTVNQLVPVKSKWARIDQELLVAGVTYLITPDGGRQTELTLGPISGYTPDPSQVRRHAHHGASAPSWAGAGEQ